MLLTRFDWIRKAIERQHLTPSEKKLFEECEKKADEGKAVSNESFLERIFRDCMWRSWGEPFKEDPEEEGWGI
jgi:hypothetical protein